ncbi:dienelactone hydrolase family protein [Ferrovibrio sp.]|uniref:dienelactone hydrolase family protein n=1 Tax=Ferrovibrio sp. TaxID=1917215 RepID=UPI0025BAA3C6|nr:dienelactone hydrolase family protein [Ferrovibrio sp.]
MYKWLIAALVAAHAAALPVKAETLSTLEAGQTGKLTFMGETPKNYDYLIRGLLDATPLTGTLVMPKNAKSKVPAVVIIHGSGGLSDRETDWAEFFVQNGWAAFYIDSFTDRGLKGTGSNQSALSYSAGIADAYSGLRLLATHPGIDPKRIALIGFSRGGTAAAYSIFDKLRRPVSPDHKFAAHVALYPGCSMWSEQTTGAPMRIYVGDQDDYERPETCQRFAEMLRAKGVDAQVTIYPSVRHGFDRQLYRPEYSGKAEQWKACNMMTFMDNWTYKRFDTGEVRPISEVGSYLSTCKGLGAGSLGNKQAREQVRLDVQKFLSEVFK